MAFTNLPVELLHQVVQYLIPENLESIALSCRPLFRACAAFLPNHKRLRHRYENFTYSTLKPDAGEEVWDSVTEATGVKIRHAGDLLDRIAEEPVIARYIQKADLRGDSSKEGYVTKVPVDSVFDRLAGDARLRDLVQASTAPYLGDTGLRTDDLLRGKSWFSDTLVLLTMLPNATELALPTWWDDPWHDGAPFGSFLDAIVRRANRHPGGASLSKVSVLAPCRGTGYDEHEALQRYDALLALDPLRGAHLASVVAEVASGDGAPYHPRPAAYGAHLETLELVGCVVGAPELARLLRRARALRRLCIAHENKYEWLGEYWDVGAAVATIQRVAGARLEELCLHAHNCCSTGTTLTDMSGFERLRTLELDLNMLLCPSYEEALREEEEEEGGGGGDSDEDEDADVEDMRYGERFDRLVSVPSHTTKLVDILPASIETLTLLGSAYPTLMTSDGTWTSVRPLAELFRDFGRERASKLPALKAITMTRAADNAIKSPEYVELVAELESAGVSFVADDGWVAGLDEAFFKRFGVESEDGGWCSAPI